VKSIALAVAVGLLLMTGCNRGIENQEAVRKAILDHLAKRGGFNAAMEVNIAAVTFRQDEADATVSYRVKGTPGGAGMTMNYTLERKGNAWVVKEKAESGGMPHGATVPAPGAMMPSGHPDIGAKQPAEPKK
jgi:glutamate/tyrosine decarboxylase-like PLP-dependent enzyme